MVALSSMSGSINSESGMGYVMDTTLRAATPISSFVHRKFRVAHGNSQPRRISFRYPAFLLRIP